MHMCEAFNRHTVGCPSKLQDSSAATHIRAAGMTTLQPRLMTLQHLAIPAEHLVLQLKSSRSIDAVESSGLPQQLASPPAPGEAAKGHPAAAGGLRSGHAPSMIARVSLVCAWGAANMALLLSNR